MKHNKRIGTLTAGLGLIIFGLAFLGYTLVPSVEFLSIILRFWPIILIFLGLEMLFARFSKEDGYPKFDFISVLIMLICIGFAFICEFTRSYLAFSGVLWF